jgi:hypothetical protein
MRARDTSLGRSYPTTDLATGPLKQRVRTGQSVVSIRSCRSPPAAHVHRRSDALRQSVAGVHRERRRPFCRRRLDRTVKIARPPIASRQAFAPRTLLRRGADAFDGRQSGPVPTPSRRDRFLISLSPLPWRGSVTVNSRSEKTISLSSSNRIAQVQSTGRQNPPWRATMRPPTQGSEIFLRAEGFEGMRSWSQWSQNGHGTRRNWLDRAGFAGVTKAETHVFTLVSRILPNQAEEG